MEKINDPAIDTITSVGGQVCYRTMLSLLLLLLLLLLFSLVALK